MPAATKKHKAVTRSTKSAQKGTKYWSGEVTQNSDALDLERNIFTWKDPGRIARSLAQSARQSKRKKGTPLQSAMSMVNFYINRAGANLGSEQKKTLEQVKDKLRAIFGEE